MGLAPEFPEPERGKYDRPVGRQAMETTPGWLRFRPELDKPVVASVILYSAWNQLMRRAFFPDDPRTADTGFKGVQKMDWDRISGGWKEFRGKVKETWGQLTDDELDQIDGNREQLEGRIQQKYGYAKDQARQEVDDWLNRQ